MFPLASAASSGKEHLLATLRWLVHRGLIPASDPLTQVDYGWEVRNTGGAARTFAVTSYRLPPRPPIARRRFPRKDRLGRRGTPPGSCPARSPTCPRNVPHAARRDIASRKLVLSTPGGFQETVFRTAGWDLSRPMPDGWQPTRRRSARLPSRPESPCPGHPTGSTTNVARLSPNAGQAPQVIKASRAHG